MRQQTLADNGFERFRKRTRRETFLLEMDSDYSVARSVQSDQAVLSKAKWCRPPAGWIGADAAYSFSATLV